MTSGDERSLRWPRERFYWGVLDASILPRRPDAERLGYLFEPLIPQPFDELQAVYHPLPNRRYIACAITRAALADLAPAAVTLAPDALPDFVGDEIKARVDPARLNVLTGEFTPPAVRRARARLRMTASAVALLACGIAGLGFERRASAAQARSEALALWIEDVQRQVLGPQAALSPLPLPLQLEAELRGLRRSRSEPEAVALPPDAAHDLVALLSRWPKELEVETDSVHVTDRSLHVQARFSESGDAQKLADALVDLPGWRLAQPSIQALEDGVRATIEFQRKEERAR